MGSIVIEYVGIDCCAFAPRHLRTVLSVCEDCDYRNAPSKTIHSQKSHASGASDTHGHRNIVYKFR